jgi:phosphoribosylformimino-5-aminoimidazole carboxamide ribotide isomerase
MILIPAIDLKEGHCVRLRQGNMDETTVFSDDPVAMAGKWVDQGCGRLHLVDLDGAFKGEPINADVIEEISASFPDLEIQIGGGIRSIETVEAYLEAGVNYVIIGTMAVKRPEFVTQLCSEFPGRFEDQGVAAIVYTDISRDGMMEGVNVEATQALAKAISVPVIASGGVTDMDCIVKLNAVKDAGIEGVIIGRALYERTISLVEAQAYIDQN